MNQVTLVEFTVTVLQSEDGVVKSNVKTCVVGGIYDLAKDAVVRQAIDQLKAQIVSGNKPKEKNNG